MELEERRDSLRCLVHRLIRHETSGAPRLGDLAVKTGIITRPNLERALGRQGANGSRRRLLGDVLVSDGYITDQQLGDLLAEQSRLAMSSSDAAEEDDENLRSIAGKLKSMKEVGR